MKSLRKLIERIERELNADPFPELIFHRTYAGRVQRAQGAWSWWADDSSGREVLASHYPIAVLLRAKRLEIGSPFDGTVLEVDPAREGPR